MIYQFLFWLTYVVWLLTMMLFWPLCLLLAKRNDPLETGHVLAKETICRLLFEKSKLSEADYLFEHVNVVESYCSETFRGYEVLVFPVIWSLKNGDSLDSQILYFVRSWITVQKQRLLGEGQAHWFHRLFTKFAVGFAKGIGRVFPL